MHKFLKILCNVDIDKLSEEFVNYQILCSSDIPSSIK